MEGGKTFNRWLIVVGALLIQVSLGAIYIYSVFKPGLKASFPDWSNTDLALPSMLVLLFFGLATIFAGRVQDKIGPRYVAMTGAVLLGLALLFGFLAYVFFRPGTARWIMATTRLISIDWAREQFEVVQGAVHAYRARVGTIWLAGAASLVIQALAVLYYLAIAHALGIPLPASAAFLMVPLCTLLQAVPVSFNGWGLREGLFTLYFSQVGLPRSSALAFSLVGAGLMVLLSLSGAFVWMARSSGAAPDAPDA
mgnify:CR=1 FL=1